MELQRVLAIRACFGYHLLMIPSADGLSIPILPIIYEIS